ncbi:MAG: hypothetical protein GY953_58910 [bacterium]|nr:hypothetical protein [bacterium]
MSRFLENAAEIFDAAERSFEAGHSPSDLTILIGPNGGISLVADSDWPLDSLQAHRGARMVYRVSQRDKTVRLEGREGSRTCVFETAKPERAARRLLADPPVALLRQSVGVPPPAPFVAD